MMENGMVVSEDEVECLVKFFDSDGNNMLSYEEFIQIFLPCVHEYLR